MSGKHNVETSEFVAPAPVSDSVTKHSEKDMGKEGTPSESVPSMSAPAGNATSGFKGVANQPSASEKSVYYPPSYDYYPSVSVGYDDKGYFNNPGGSYTGVQSDNSSMLYYYPGLTPYTTGYMGVDGKQTYASSDYLQQPYSYGSESYPLYTYDSSYAGNGTTTAGARSGPAKSMTGARGSGNSKDFSAAKTNNNLSRKTPVLPYNSKVKQHSNFSRPAYRSQPLKPLNKLGSSFQSENLMKGYPPAGRYSSYTNRNMYMQYNPTIYQSNNRVWNNNYRNKTKENVGRNGEVEALTELTRGPRADNKSKDSDKPAEGELMVEREKYNSEGFEIKYENAKFFVIKSYSEDDVHKCIKYDVWSSTPGGNKKLDAAFREADATATETGNKCPVFLFFSVNASGQFIGVAEMIGQVDFTKNMDFWQLDKWNGFFPVKWHIVKDVPNTLFRHIILANNENRAVTYSRDTQEIGLQQGLEMLGIFKSYSEKTSVLDDFNFYEIREKALKGKRASKKATSQTNGYEKHEEVSGEQSANAYQPDASSLVSLTQNLLLSSQPLQSSI